MITDTDEMLHHLDSQKCVIALVPGDKGYEEMMEKINHDDSVCSIKK